MTQNERRQIISLWQSGVSLQKIYRMLPYRRCDAVRMLNKLRQDGTLKPRKKKKENTIKMLGDAWKSGITDIKELSEMFGSTEQTTIAYLSKSGARENKRPPHNHTKKQLNKKAEAIMEVLKEGKPLSTVAKEFGVSRQYVFQLKERLEKENDI